MENFKKFYSSYRNKIIYEGGVYHVTQRAPGKESLFIEEEDYLSMLSLLKNLIDEFNIDIFSFCLMPNHFHLLLRINEVNLSKAMHSLNTSYAMNFNIKYQRKGHVFCGVYRASMCLDDVHLIGSSTYIHLNPQKAGLVKDASDYRWSSVNVYLNSEIKSFVKSNFILEMISDDLKKASCSYAGMLKEFSAVTYENIIYNPRAGINFSKAIFGSLTNFIHGRPLRDNFISAERDIDNLIEEFRTKKRRKNGLEDRKTLINLVEHLKNRGFKIVEMAKVLNISRQTLYNLTNLTNKVEP